MKKLFLTVQIAANDLSIYKFISIYNIQYTYIYVNIPCMSCGILLCIRDAVSSIIYGEY